MREPRARLLRIAMLVTLAAVSLPLQGEPATKLWGSAYYQVVGDDAASADPAFWGIAQEAGFSLNVRSAGGFELLGDFTLPLDIDGDFSPQATIPQLYVRFSPAEGVTVSAGRQRLNWGTGKVLSAIDTVEVRANPLDVRPVLAGVTGLKLELMPSDWLGVSVVALPATEIRWSRAAVRLDLTDTDLGLDLGLGAVKYAEGGVDRISLLSDGAWSSGPVVLYEEAQLRWGRQTGYGFPAMASFNDLGGGTEPVFRGLVGMMLQIELGLSRPATLLVEYLYNGDGLTTEEARLFQSSRSAWQGSGSPAGAQVPGAFSSIGGFRRHYLTAGLLDVALSRTVSLGVTCILGIESLFSRPGISLEWKPVQDTVVFLGYELFHAFRDASEQPSELLLIPFRNRVTLSVTTSFQ